MGPNESWMSEVEQQLRNMKDFSVNQSLTQLAAQGQAGYSLPSRNQTQEDPTVTGELIWIRMTSRGVANGQIFFGWRRQVKLATQQGYVWIDNGDSGTLDYHPATGLNNDDVGIGATRYPAKWNADTSQWIFFLKLSSTNNRPTSNLYPWNFSTLSVMASWDTSLRARANNSINMTQVPTLQYLYLLNDYMDYMNGRTFNLTKLQGGQENQPSMYTDYWTYNIVNASGSWRSEYAWGVVTQLYWDNVLGGFNAISGLMRPDGSGYGLYPIPFGIGVGAFGKRGRNTNLNPRYVYIGFQIDPYAFDWRENLFIGSGNITVASKITLVDYDFALETGPYETILTTANVTYTWS